MLASEVPGQRLCPDARSPALNRPAPRSRWVPRRWVPSVHFRLAAVRSRASRAAVRFFAATSDAFFARADRSFAVMVSRLRLPPILPPFRPISLMISRNNALVFLSTIPSYDGLDKSYLRTQNGTCI
jgi:hypothetical protein